MNEESDRIKIVEMPRPVPGTGEVLIKLEAAALNHRDQWCREGKYPNIKYDVVLGSDGCGEVVELGPDVDQRWIGKEVIVNPNINWGPNHKAQSKEYRILGMPDHGTFAEYMTVKPDRLVEKPEHLTAEQAAAIPLCGLTAYRAVFTKGKVKKGQNVLVTGIGGGVAQFAFQFARLSGANVYVTSGSQEKLTQTVAMGAIEGFNYRHENWGAAAHKLSGGFELVIDSTGGNMINQYLRLLKNGGKVVVYGSSTDMPKNLDIYRLFWNQLTIQGSTMGSDPEFHQMVDFVNRTQLVPVVDSVRPFADIVEAFDRMKNRKQFGKLVVRF